ncbi:MULTISPECIES: hypothetical protein [unclassified Bradyrhizobium]
MLLALFATALSASVPVTPVSDRVPSLNVEALCKATADTDKAMNLAEPQSAANCMRDETAAKQQLDSIWQATSVALRDRCEGEATAGGFQSYVDLLTCIEMADTASALSPTSPLKGASRNRNKQ